MRAQEVLWFMVYTTTVLSEKFQEEKDDLRSIFDSIHFTQYTKLKGLLRGGSIKLSDEEEKVFGEMKKKYKEYPSFPHFSPQLNFEPFDIYLFKSVLLHEENAKQFTVEDAKNFFVHLRLTFHFGASSELMRDLIPHYINVMNDLLSHCSEEVVKEIRGALFLKDF